MTERTDVPLEAVYDLTRITNIAVSPAGDTVAFTATEYDQAADEAVTSLFVVPADGSRDPHRLTTVAGASSPKWHPSGEKLAFLAARETDVERRVGWQDRDDESDDGDGETDDENEAEDADDGSDSDANEDDEPKQQVWLFDLARGGDARQVTDREEGVQGFDWSPDGDRFVLAARDPTDEERDQLERRREDGPIETTRLQHKLNGVGWTDDVTTYLFVLDRDSGETKRLDDAYGGGAFQDVFGMEPRWGPTDRIAFTSCRCERPDDTMVRDVYAIDPDGSNLRRLTDGDQQCSRLAWREDGTLGYVVRDPENWYRPAEVYHHDGDEGRSLTGELNRTVAGWGTVKWVEAEDAAYTLVGDEARTRLVRAGLDGTTERVFDAQGENRAITGFDVSADGSTAALVFSHPQEGIDVHAVAVDDLAADDPPESLRRLSAVNDDLTDEHPMPAVRRVEWESDGWTIDGVVYHDPSVDLAEGPHPLVVAIHGGPMSYDEPEFSFDHAALTSRGYVVFRPNYRGGISRGREFAEVLRGRWGTAEVEDIVAGVDALVDRGWADPDRVFGYGFSYGGIAQGYLVTQPDTDLFAAAAPEHGIYDPRADFGTSDTHNWMEAEFGLPWENTDSYDAAASILDAGEIDTPLLVMAGGEDWRCPPSQSERLYVAARKQGVDAKLVVYPDEHHNIGDPDRAIHRLEQLLAWYETHDPERGNRSAGS